MLLSFPLLMLAKLYLLPGKELHRRVWVGLWASGSQCIAAPTNMYGLEFRLGTVPPPPVTVYIRDIRGPIKGYI